DVFTASQRPKTVHRRGTEIVGGLLRPRRHLVAYRANLETIGQCPKRRSVPYFPLLAQTYQTDAQLHVARKIDLLKTNVDSRGRVQDPSAASPELYRSARFYHSRFESGMDCDGYAAP